MAEVLTDYGCCEMFLFRNVKNSELLYNAILAGDINYAMIKPSLIAHPLQVAVAVKKALLAERRTNTSLQNCPKNKGLVTRSVLTEILYNLAPSKNIATSLQTYGLEKHNKDILAVAIIKQGIANPNLRQSVLENLQSKIEGDLVSNIMDEEKGLPSITDWELVSKVHKLKWISSKQEIIDVLISRAATKDVT